MTSFSHSRLGRKLRKITWLFHRPDWAENHGIQLPVRHPQISPLIAREIYLRSYESKEIHIVRQTLEASDRVLEVGAGLGFLSAYCARRIGSERIVAYEANPTLIPLIQTIYQRNQVAPTLIQAMLGHGEGERAFHLAADFWCSSAHHQDGQRILVPQHDLNTQIRRIRPTFLIADIEGGEAEFFTQADLSGVQKICVETHEEIIGKQAVTAMIGHLESEGFQVDPALRRKNVLFLRRPA